jgi:hypothetical protein
VRLALASVFLLSSVALTACPESRRPLGDTCETSSQCATGECIANLCLDPEADDDGDGLVNRLEGALGSSPTSVDTDGDGKDDAVEVGADPATPLDTDGDGKPDLVESALLDADSDCVPDERDADDAVPETDPASRARAVCRVEGVCAEGVLANCEGGVAVCDYSGVTGYEEAETACDDLDNDCDGEVDEPFLTGGTATYDGGPNAADAGKVKGESCGVGACAGGVVICDPAAMFGLTCSTTVNAGAPTCGADNDCDGTADSGEGIAACQLFFADGEDGDGFGSGDGRCLCDADTTHTTDEGGDCDEARDDVYPGAAGLCGTDADCDESALDADELCDDANDEALDGCNACAPSPLPSVRPDVNDWPRALTRVGAGTLAVWDGWYATTEGSGSRLTFEGRDMYGRVVGRDTLTLGENAWFAEIAGLGEVALAFHQQNTFDAELQSWFARLYVTRISPSGAVVVDSTSEIPLGTVPVTNITLRAGTSMPLGDGVLVPVRYEWPDEGCNFGYCQVVEWLRFDASGALVARRTNLPQAFVDAFYSIVLAPGENGGILGFERHYIDGDPGGYVFRLHRFASFEAGPELLFELPCEALWCSMHSVAWASGGGFWVGFEEEVQDPVTENYVQRLRLSRVDSEGVAEGEPVFVERGPYQMYGGPGLMLETDGQGGAWALPLGGSENERGGPKDEIPPFTVGPDAFPARVLASDGTASVIAIDREGFEDTFCARQPVGVFCLALESRYEEVAPEQWETIVQPWVFRFGADGNRLPAVDPRAPAAE